MLQWKKIIYAFFFLLTKDDLCVVPPPKITASIYKDKIINPLVVWVTTGK